MLVGGRVGAGEGHVDASRVQRRALLFVLSGEEIPHLICYVRGEVPVVTLVVNTPEHRLFRATGVAELGDVSGFLFHNRARRTQVTLSNTVRDHWCGVVRRAVQMAAVEVRELVMSSVNDERWHRAGSAVFDHRVVERARDGHHARHEVRRLAREVHGKSTAVGHAGSIDALAIDIEVSIEFVHDLARERDIAATWGYGVRGSFPCIFDARRVDHDRFICGTGVCEAGVVAEVFRAVVPATVAEEDWGWVCWVVVLGDADDCPPFVAAWEGEFDVDRFAWLGVFDVRVRVRARGGVPRWVGCRFRCWRGALAGRWCWWRWELCSGWCWILYCRALC